MAHRFILIAVLTFAGSSDLLVAQQGTLLLRNGMTVSGSYFAQGTVDKKAIAKESGAETIAVIDDQLRRVYVHKLGMVQGFRENVREDFKVEIRQLEHRGGIPIAGLGQIYGATPFNEHGRREISIRGPAGSPLQILQGITLLTDRYAVVESMRGRPAYNWDMRLATSTFPSETLRKIFRQIYDADNLNERFNAVRFFITAGRWEDAKYELEQIQRNFPETDQSQQIIQVNEQIAIQLLDEARIRRAAGQYEFARSMLSRFPPQLVGRERRIEISDEIASDKKDLQRVANVKVQLKNQISELPGAIATRLDGFQDELESGLSVETLTRLSDYLRLGNDDTLPLENRVALAVGGWLMGGGEGLSNLEVAASLRSVRDLVVDYLTETNPGRRDELLQQMSSLEGAQPEYIAKMLPLMTPVMRYPEEAANADVQGMFRINENESQTDNEGTLETASGVNYAIQLPPEYDPHRQYPCIVALHPWSGTPEAQLDWWAGAPNAIIGQRKGQASRLGYIVIAPVWKRPDQKTYEYTAIEHHRVLSSLRHAMRHTSIDADRVYMAGHGEGGTAAWDIAISHPDIWAGMVIIGGEPEKTIRHYDRNSEYLPSYFVFGEIDGGPVPLVRSGAVYDDYMNPRTDSMLVEYRGRGREFFFEETPEIFKWMELPSHRRRPIPETLKLATMRPGDNFFWWLELHQLKPAAMANPVLWTNIGRAGSVEAKINADNSIRVISHPSEAYTLWFRPDLGLDLNEPITIRTGGSQRKTFQYERDLRTLLEDVRTRADRVRPYWARIDLP